MSAYRTASPPTATREPSWLDRMLCRITGHRWVVLRRNLLRSTALGHLHPMAGADAVCARCHAHWLDGFCTCPACGRHEAESCGAPPETSKGGEG